MKDTVRILGPSRPNQPAAKKTVRLELSPSKHGPEARAKQEEWLKKQKPPVEPATPS